MMSWEWLRWLIRGSWLQWERPWENKAEVSNQGGWLKEHSVNVKGWKFGLCEKDHIYV